MKVNIRFRDGVAAGLCGGCEHASIMINTRGQELVKCHFHHPSIRMTAPIVSCSDFQAKGTLDRWDMEKIAWTVETKQGKVVGFKPPKPTE
jgi:hypothetical protein